jgi:hypothetical protein
VTTLLVDKRPSLLRERPSIVARIRIKFRVHRFEQRKFANSSRKLVAPERL